MFLSDTNVALQETFLVFIEYYTAWESQNILRLPIKTLLTKTKFYRDVKTRHVHSKREECKQTGPVQHNGG